jgi:hypothetical protein
MRKWLGWIGLLASISFLVFMLITMESAGRISWDEFLPFLLFYTGFSFFVSLWAFFNGEQEDAKDKKPRARI